MHTETIVRKQAHVRDFALSYLELEPGRHQAQSGMRIASQGNKPVAGATVNIEWTLPNGKRIPQTATTNLSGVSRFQSTSRQGPVLDSAAPQHGTVQIAQQRGEMLDLGASAHPVKEK